jgi:hypothetical protein
VRLLPDETRIGPRRTDARYQRSGGRRPLHYRSRPNRPSNKPSRLDSEAFRSIQTAVGRNYDTVTIPLLSTGATDMS